MYFAIRCCVCYFDGKPEDERQIIMCQHCKDRRSCVHNLEQDLVSSRPSRQDAIAKIEKFRKYANNVMKPFAERLDLVKCHYIFGMQEMDSSAVEEVKQLLSGGELGSCYDSKTGTLNMSLRTDGMKRYVIRDLRMKSLPRWISKLGVAFKVIDVSGNPSLSHFPLDELCSMESSLQEVKCESCVRLQLPPPEIASQGGAAAFTYLQSVKRDSEANKRINLILIGNGEAGKTSVLRALRSDKDKADKIEVDRRTIGIDLHEWEPEDADGLTCDVMDFGGQQIYAKTNQYFIVRRALYLLVWNVRGKRDKQSMEELKMMIATWLRATQARVPGSSVLLVATHIDLVGESEVTDQCEEVKACVEEELKKMAEDEDLHILPLHVINGGESFRVNCLEGQGVKELRRSVCKTAKELLWWEERIPRPYLRLREAVEKRKSGSVSYVKVEEYKEMLRESGVSEKEHKVATSFLHDMGVLKYFGHELSADQSKRDLGKYSVEDTVFIDPVWMIDVFKGVMRHDWEHLLDFFQQDPTKSKKTKKLLHLGIIDEDMLEYLWPQQDSDFWRNAKTDKTSRSEEVGFIKSHVEVQEAVALLRGCDLAHFLGEGMKDLKDTDNKSRELLCPGIIPSFTHEHKRAVTDKDKQSLCASVECEYNIFPAGFIDRLVVLCAARHFEVDCSGSMAVMKGWGRTLLVSWREDNDKHVLRADASTRQQIENLQEDLKQLEAFFPGMKRRRSDKESSGKEAVQIGIFTQGERSRACGLDIERKVKKLYKAENLPLGLTCQTHPCDERGGAGDECLVNILCISTECVDEQGPIQGESSFSKLWNRLTASEAIIIPVVLTDYYDKQIKLTNRFNEWWPQEIQGMERYRIFHQYKENDQGSMRTLYDGIIKKLHQGRGSFEDLYEVTSQNELLCQACLHDRSESQPASQGDRAVGRFDRSEIKAALDKERKGMTDMQQELEQEDVIKHKIMIKAITCTRGHTTTVEEVLAFNGSSSPCPSCLKDKRVPHFFSRPKCLSMLARDLTAKIYCDGCQREMDVLDVTPPQVFLSYQWGHDNSTQKMVREVKRRIEEQTSLQCWFDVEGGINPGEDHMQKMELGVSRCEVFVVFMSDKYVKSGNCRREFARACEAGKYIIPVLVPVLYEASRDSKDLESESGWKGDKGGEDWWKRIAELEKETSEAANKVKVDWTYLASFSKPLEVQAKREQQEQQQQEKDRGGLHVSGLEALVAAVQARVYRGGVVFHEVAVDMALTCVEPVEHPFLRSLHLQKDLLNSILDRISLLQSKIRSGIDNPDDLA
ncbi:hypothetical protein GUITHDRAFT_121310 [Guillardia theta CCMP2712]|uniref:non-specific serine/threonine protein kinase n=1 Tax=Guillardia theta (strain CCMP2712) TaxID=905079 RepID=L1I8G5_GUITC|nr:hypothetical protein GUITHDRAFT_121310 [Guillardia theta CCMP2712]EKX32523.1 hypothetical protein GUITHDRAFT_121310 [Guillardia theta CCMP2712]|eukprot:XP_005819503.1 hypothetical protein GUITHDRAFT_121310 [Guillardia theta CCMP2712]